MVTFSSRSRNDLPDGKTDITTLVGCASAEVCLGRGMHCLIASSTGGY